MKEIKGDIWDYHNKGSWIVITTNGTVRKDGACVMGRGVAKQAAVKFPRLPYSLGEHIKGIGNNVCSFRDFRVVSFPVKHNWWEKADLNLISMSCQQLAEDYLGEEPIYMVRPGCGNGRLNWKDVKPILQKYLDDRFIVVQKGG